MQGGAELNSLCVRLSYATTRGLKYYDCYQVIPGRFVLVQRLILEGVLTLCEVVVITDGKDLQSCSSVVIAKRLHPVIDLLTNQENFSHTTTITCSLLYIHELKT